MLQGSVGLVKVLLHFGFLVALQYSINNVISSLCNCCPGFPLHDITILIFEMDQSVFIYLCISLYIRQNTLYHSVKFASMKWWWWWWW